MVISRTPFRISFFGGGTDYPSWYLKHGGAVLATTIDKYCYLTCRYLPPFFPHLFRVVWSKIETCQSIDEILHPAVRETLRYLGINSGLGLWVNYIFTAIWFGEVLLPGLWGLTVNRRLNRVVRSVFLFMIINGAFVFVAGPQRWFGLLLVVTLLTIWWNDTETFSG